MWYSEQTEYSSPLLDKQLGDFVLRISPESHIEIILKMKTKNPVKTDETSDERLSISVDKFHCTVNQTENSELAEVVVLLAPTAEMAAKVRKGFSRSASRKISIYVVRFSIQLK